MNLTLRLLRTRLSILLVGFLVSACASRPPALLEASAADAETYRATDRAIVVLAAEHRHANVIFGETKSPTSIVFALKRPVLLVEDGQTLMKRYVRFHGLKRTRAYSVPPGDYALIVLDAYKSNANASYRSRGWNRSTGAYEVSGFSIGPGDVVYLGRLVSRDEFGKDGLFLSVENQPDEARLAIQVAFPGEIGNGLVEKMKTELLKVPPKAW